MNTPGSRSASSIISPVSSSIRTPDACVVVTCTAIGPLIVIGSGESLTLTMSGASTGSPVEASVSTPVDASGAVDSSLSPVTVWTPPPPPLVVGSVSSAGLEVEAPVLQAS